MATPCGVEGHRWRDLVEQAHDRVGARDTGHAIAEPAQELTVFLIAGAGYLFGHALEQVMADLRCYETWGLVGVAVVFVVVTLVAHVAKREKG